ncbi:MAG: electron transport complex subunit RsxE [Pseudomonadota bacterium]
MSNQLRTVFSEGLWHNNAGIVQLLGLCPLLAISNTAVNAIGLAIATLAVLTMSNFLVSLARPLLQPEIRIPAYVLIIAALVTASELIFNAFLPILHDRLGIFLPLIVTNCAIVARAEAFASRHSPALALIDGLAYGIGFGWVLVIIGMCRELIGTGTVFAGMNLLLPTVSADGIRVADSGLLLALLPPGAFFALAALLIVRNLIRDRRVR